MLRRRIEPCPWPLLQGLTKRLPALQSNVQFQVFALINDGSVSSASLLSEILKVGVPDYLAPYAPGVGFISTKLVGEPTGEPPQIHGDPLTFTLPASCMLVQYLTAYSPPFPDIPNLDAIYPDISAPVQSTDYFARHDAILAAVLARASVPLAGPTGDSIVVNSASFRAGTGIAPGSFASAAGSGLFVTAPVSAQPGAILNQDGGLNTSAAPAARGSLLQIFGTGYCPLDASGQAAASVWIANLPVPVLYSGPAPGIAGLWQINVQIPNDPAVAGQVPVFVGR
jgi:hypothetical protein